MEADILPVTACLVPGPHSRIALGTGPAVKGDDEGAGVIAVVGHDAGHIGYTVETEGVAPADPGHVSLEHADSGVPDLLDDIPLQQGLDTLLGMQVGLGPEAYLDALRAGIVTERFQVQYIAVERGSLAVTGAVTVVGQNPS